MTSERPCQPHLAFIAHGIVFLSDHVDQENEHDDDDDDDDDGDDDDDDDDDGDD